MPILEFLDKKINSILSYFEKIAENKLVFGGLLTGIFFLGFLIMYLALTLGKTVTQNPFSQVNEFSIATPAPVNQMVPEKGVYNFVLLGYGGAGHEGSLLTDSIIIVHLDTNSRKITLITIPRDLWVPGNHKINSAGVANGFQNVGTELTNVTGLPINYFVAVDFGNFSRLIDTLGGITADVPKTFDDAFYPILGEENNTCGFSGEEINTFKAKYSGFNLEKQFTCRYEHLHFDQGSTNLDGATALKFVRSRHGDSDFGRSLRQIAVLRGIFSKLSSFQSSGKINDIINSLLGLVKTDLNAGIIKTLVDIIGSPANYSFGQVQLSTDNVLTESKSSEGAYILIPKAGSFNFSQVKSLISKSF